MRNLIIIQDVYTGEGTRWYALYPTDQDRSRIKSSQAPSDEDEVHEDEAHEDEAHENEAHEDEAHENEAHEDEADKGERDEGNDEGDEDEDEHSAERIRQFDEGLDALYEFIEGAKSIPLRHDVLRTAPPEESYTWHRGSSLFFGMEMQSFPRANLFEK
ncbi:hypothetical protein L596_008874 [Steinernema carpocapsae]|uniref:Uncharacterized protein n=1 Tax=Steinernema carpocapsae TaxID=34508 RepID=A0A4U5PEK2_STECR|nr:hypothetical protein L596_008874 [Steinernema carpocapsae]